MFLVIPPQIWVERTLAGVPFDSYWQFWGTVFTLVPYPRGNLSWHHLWFLPYILTFSLGGLPLFVFLRGPSGHAFVERLVRLCARPLGVYLLALPSVAVAFFLGPRWPVTMNLISDWANLASSLLSFQFGYVVSSSAHFLALVERRRHEFLCVAAGWAVLVFAIRLDSPARLSGQGRLLAFSVIDSYFAFTMILALVGWSRARFNRPSALLRAANEAVYPFYIVHQTVTVLLGYAWLGWIAPFPLKFAALLAGTFAGSWVFYEAVRRHPLTRVLFGMKA